MIEIFALLLLSTLIFLRPLYSGLVYPLSNQYYLFIISILPLLFFKPTEKFKFYGISREEWVWIGFIIWTGIAFVWSVNRHSTLIQLELALTYFYAYFLIKRISPSLKKVIFYVIIFTSIFVSVYAIYQYYWGLEETRKFVFENIRKGIFSPDFLTRLSTNRSFSTFVYPNALAGYLVILIPFTLSLFWKLKKRWRYYYLIIPLIQIFALILTKSKGGILSLFFSSFLILWLFLHRRGKIYSFILLSVILLTLFSSSFVRKTAIDSMNVRISYWKASMRMIKAKPLTGFGPGCFGRVFPLFKVPGREDTQMAHNNYFQVFSEGGVFYLILFISFFYLSLKKLSSSKDKILTRGIQCGIFAFLIHSLVDFDFYIPGITLILFSIIPLGISSSSKKVLRQYSYLLPFLFVFLFVSFISSKIIRAGNFFSESLEMHRKGDLENAVSYLEKSIRIYPWGEDIYRINYHFRLGELYLEEKKIDKAIGEIKKAVKIDRYRFFYWEKLAYLYSLKKNYKKALKYINYAIKYYPSHPRLKKERDEILEKINKGSK